MVKRKRRRAGAENTGKYSMTTEKIAQVRLWLHRMRVYLGKAVSLSKRMDQTRLSEDDDLYWALVKYAENVQKCAVQLDNVNDSIFPCLAEIPMKSEDDELSWDGLKGMRIRLAHKFWDINPTTLWSGDEGLSGAGWPA